MYKSYCITVRPLLGISPATEDRLIKWFCKQDYYFACIEKEGNERHLHGQVWLDVARDRGVIVKSIKRCCEETVENWTSAQSKVLSNGVKIAYSDWYESYLVNNETKKDDAKNVLIEQVPDKTETYYPTEEEQKQVKDKANAKSPEYFYMETEFFLKYPELKELRWGITLEKVSVFLGNLMFVSKKIRVVSDTRRAKQMCLALYNYLKEDFSVDYFLTAQQVKDEIDRKKVEEMTNDYDQENQGSLVI